MRKIKAYKNVEVSMIDRIYFTRTCYINIKDLINNKYESRVYWYYKHPFFLTQMIKI
jgi:hypothetical protein